MWACHAGALAVPIGAYLDGHFTHNDHQVQGNCVTTTQQAMMTISMFPTLCSALCCMAFKLICPLQAVSQEKGDNQKVKREGFFISSA